MKFAGIILVQLIVILLIGKTHSSPFLFSTSKWIYQRLFNGTEDHSTQNIEDLSEEGPFFAHKNKSTSVSDLRKSANLEDASIDKGSNTTNTTEESLLPGILHRKISKILNKLQLYSAVRSTIHNVRKQQEENQNTIPKESDSTLKINATTTTKSPEEIEDSEEFNKLRALLSMNSPKEEETSAVTNLQYLPPKINNNIEQDPFGIDRIENTDAIEADGMLFPDDTKKKPTTLNRVSLELGNFGIHIMEIVGSIATIFLTAAYQAGHYASSFTQASGTTPSIENMGTIIDIRSRN